MSEKTYQNIVVESLPESRAKISGEISAEAFEKARKKALEQITSNTEVPGFRAGKAPEAVVVKHVGEMKILERAAEAATNEAYAEILREHNVRAIGIPTIAITKIAVGNPLGFVMETAIMPEIKLDNYAALSKEAKAKVPDASEVVDEKEIEAVINDLRKRVGLESSVGKNHSHDGHDHTHDDNDLPELNEEFIKKFGEFKDVEAFKEKVKENIIEQKKFETKDKRRASIADKLITETKFDVPELIVESELDTMIGQFRADVERSGYTLEGYLTHIKKKEEDIRKEWRENAVRRARLELILKHIARSEKITLNEEEVKKEIDHITSHHKNADRFRVRMYVENLMTNQKVFEYLENL